MSTKRLQELLNSDKNSIKINKDLLKTLDLEEAVLYSFLVYEFDKNSKHYENKYFDGDKYFLCPVDDIENELDTSLSCFPIFLLFCSTFFLHIKSDLLILYDILIVLTIWDIFSSKFLLILLSSAPTI